MTDATFREDLINRLFRIPAKVTSAVLVAAIIIGLLVGGALGWILLGAAVVVLAGMLALLWPSITTVERMMRLSAVLLVAALAIVRLVPAG